MTLSNRWRAPALVVLGCFAALSSWHARAQAPNPQDVLSLSASASLELTRDVLNIAFTATHEGAEPAAVQAQLMQALNAALAEARKAARPGMVEVSTGNFSLYPRHAPKGGPTTWMGTAELRVEGRDTEAIAALVARIRTMSVARVGYSLSREAREKVEGEVAQMAIERFREKARDYARHFGFAEIVIREVQVGTNEPPPFPMPVMRAARSGMAAEEALPVEAGKATVSATVSGSVQMKK